ncbi:Ase1p NDAI_0F00620 [Naumovozyma dairenensis CBS 421]|uniref:Uncharacterized protein n=1 Tax=Naumovozyma dairenensis (strain ATCC 10597 / BCRC 20456 / CBS 421 / NBRC 0211 / NRRL Y-12639) TaxID=1071378 RepID=G0WC70_NAUDC|nr:hypothetical protein NDAI_0F00620 [Naumovozyma dairenensis CBS 421]CCD25381.1 hypothetical protein NDAI_0F00620 [Naumovozyma dairenensis CBS 421]
MSSPPTQSSYINGETPKDSTASIGPHFENNSNSDTMNSKSSMAHSDMTSVTTPSKIENKIVTISRNLSMSPSKEYMTLTPVRLKELDSPLKGLSLTDNLTRTVTTTDACSRNEVEKNSGVILLQENNGIYVEKFNLIGRQLQTLLENLNVVYQKIGYSNSEIISKEKLIFNALSESITTFYIQAEKEMENLNYTNDKQQQMLNKILEILQDSSGINTIPDLYIRNAILIQQSKTVPLSPKKPLSLLKMQNSLQKARNYVFKDYIPKIVDFLQYTLRLKRYIETIQQHPIHDKNNNNNNNNNNSEIELSLIPSVSQLNELLAKIESSANDYEIISRIIQENDKIFLKNDYFKAVSPTVVDKIKQLINLYENEYNSRLTKIIQRCHHIYKLNNDLCQDMNEQVTKLTSSYMNINAGNNDKKQNNLLLVNNNVIEELEVIFNSYQKTYEKRTRQKNRLLKDCQCLWTKLKISPVYIEKFKKENSNISETTILNIENELNNLELKKQKIIKKLIQDSLQRIKDLSETLQISSEYILEFSNNINSLIINSQSLKDDEIILAMCEDEIKDLEEKLEIYTPVLNLIKDFQSLQQDKLFLEDSSKDSSRLLSRNSHKILLNEEKTRKRVTRHFPRVIKELKIKLEQAQQIFDKPFIINGEPLTDVIGREEKELLNRYPRSRTSITSSLTHATENKLRNTKTSPYRIQKRHTSDQGGTITIPPNAAIKKHNSSMNKTPTRGNMVSQAYRSTSDGVILSTSKRHLQGTVSSSSPNRKKITKLLPPTVIPKRNEIDASSHGRNMSQGTKNQQLQAEASSMVSPLLYYKSSATRTTMPTASIPIRPTRLFPISLNQRSQQQQQQPQQPQPQTHIPVLRKTKSNLIINEEKPKELMLMVEGSNKENSMVFEEINGDTKLITNSNSNNNNTQYPSELSSPFKEREHSVYKLSMSPDGRFKLNIQQRDLENPFEDTSILDDEDSEIDKHYLDWKSEQMIKLDELKQGQQQERMLPQ